MSSFLQWRIHIFICRVLGWKITPLYITTLGTLYFFFKRREKWKIRWAVESVFHGGKNSPQIKSITRNVFRGIRSHYYEKLFNAFSSAKRLRSFLGSHIESECMAAIREGLSKGKGVLLITGHFGGVEYIPGYLGANHYPVTILVRFSSNLLRNISIQKAAKFKTRIIDVDHTPNPMKAILCSLRENRVVITQCDELDKWRPSRHNGNSFLGKPVSLDRAINILVKRSRASLVFGMMHRCPNYRYRFSAASWGKMAKQFPQPLDMSVGAVVLKVLERYIYKHPEQWYQWKKFAEIPTAPPCSAGDAKSSPLPFLNPSPGKAPKQSQTRIDWMPA